MRFRGDLEHILQLYPVIRKALFISAKVRKLKKKATLWVTFVIFKLPHFRAYLLFPAFGLDDILSLFFPAAFDLYIAVSASCIISDLLFSPFLGS